MSEIINCGIYIFSPAALFKLMGEIIQKNYQKMRYAVVISSCKSLTALTPMEVCKGLLFKAGLLLTFSF